MYLLFAIENFYPNGGFGDLKFVFDNKEELKEKIDTELNAFNFYTNGDGEFDVCFENLAKANEISKNFGVSIENARKAVEYLTK